MEFFAMEKRYCNNQIIILQKGDKEEGYQE